MTEDLVERQATLIQCDEARQFIDGVADQVTRNLLNMAFVRFVKSRFMDKGDAPRCDFDMLYFVRVMETVFAEHDILSATLAGEMVGRWFDELNEA